MALHTSPELSSSLYYALLIYNYIYVTVSKKIWHSAQITLPRYLHHDNTYVITSGWYMEYTGWTICSLPKSRVAKKIKFTIALLPALVTQERIARSRSEPHHCTRRSKHYPVVCITRNRIFLREMPYIFSDTVTYIGHKPQPNQLHYG